MTASVLAPAFMQRGSEDIVIVSAGGGVPMNVTLPVDGARRGRIHRVGHRRGAAAGGGLLAAAAAAAVSAATKAVAKPGFA